jgi:hypothetical protein
MSHRISDGADSASSRLKPVPRRYACPPLQAAGHIRSYVPAFTPKTVCPIMRALSLRTLLSVTRHDSQRFFCARDKSVYRGRIMPVHVCYVGSRLIQDPSGEYAGTS